MNNQKLNIESISLKLRDLGFNQSMLADKLSVSRETVSKWISGESFPRPKLLLQMATILNLAFDQIVLADKSLEPVVAFRKKAHTKTVDVDYSRAIDMGGMLKKIVLKQLRFSRSNRQKRFNYIYFTAPIVVILVLPQRLLF